MVDLRDVESLHRHAEWACDLIFWFAERGEHVFAEIFARVNQAEAGNALVFGHRR